MNNGYILFYDSGVGGINTFLKTKELLPNENYIYYADDKNCPYGNKSNKQLKSLVVRQIKRLLKTYNIKLLVFACNTVTTAVVPYLRTCLDVPIVGTEPAIIPASKISKTKKVLVIATASTIKQFKFKSLEKRAGAIIYSVGLKKLAKEIEQKMLYGKEFDFESYIKTFNKKIKRFNIDVVVLGCTHYCFYKGLFNSKLNVTVIDGTLGVAKRVKSLIEEYGMNAKEKKQDVLLLSSKDKVKTNLYWELIKGDSGITEDL